MGSTGSAGRATAVAETTGAPALSAPDHATAPNWSGYVCPGVSQAGVQLSLSGVNRTNRGR
ncbi:hypothetical protein [Streptodolium elevatio]|uniref:Uncharacterized protein n=1 Tax=Streptodolium elevatio TaxID=3157996 RepID=A0ABV3DKI5_9ACTN